MFPGHRKWVLVHEWSIKNVPLNTVQILFFCNNIPVQGVKNTHKINRQSMLIVKLFQHFDVLCALLLVS